MLSTDLENNLTKKGIAPTAMRIRVLEFLLACDTAVGLSDIENALSPVDRVTIYRTLKTFEEQGVAHSIDDGSNITKYALCDRHCRPGLHIDFHIHFHCGQCNETTCMPDQSLPAVTLPDGYRVDEMNLTVKGSCRKCLAEGIEKNG